MEDAVPFASIEFLIFFGILLLARAADFLSTWVATPNLVLEGNPIAKRLGWKMGILFNLLLCLALAFYPLTAIMMATTSFLVAARNFQQAWLMRTMGEEDYRDWYVMQLLGCRKGLYVFCLLAQTGLIGLVGGVLTIFSSQVIPFGIGVGIVAYAFTVLFYTSLSMWRIRRRMR